jgi:hypothetical protein
VTVLCGWGYSFQPSPPPDEVVHIQPPFVPHGLHGEVLDRWAVVACNLTWHLVAGVLLAPPSTDWDMQEWTICPRGIGEALQYTNVHGNFKIKFQTYIFEIILKDKDNFLRLLFAFTTSDVYLTFMFKFEIDSTTFREIFTYPWPYINSVVMTDDNLHILLYDLNIKYLLLIGKFSKYIF